MKKLTAMPAFFVLLISQFISFIGTAMTGFAITIWMYQKTGKVMSLALIGFASTLPLIIATPIAGVFIDRMNRKLAMAISDLAAGISTIFLLIMLSINKLELIHIYIAVSVSTLFNTFQWPSYSASISLMVDKKHYGRTSALLEMASNASNILAPTLAGALLAIFKTSGLHIILFLDIVTFSIAVLSLLFIQIPQPILNKQEMKISIFKDALFGFDYIKNNKGLLKLLISFLFSNLFFTILLTLYSPYILEKTGSKSVILGLVNTFGAAGGLAGGFIISIWGGPKKKIYGLFTAMLLSPLIIAVAFGLNTKYVIWMIGAAVVFALLALGNSSSQAIWQAKVKPEIQGRVFSARRCIAWLINPASFIAAGFFADKIFEPLMSGQNIFSQFFIPIVGTGKGSGMAVMFILFGFLGFLVPIIASRYHDIRNIEIVMRDFDEARNEN